MLDIANYLVVETLRDGRKFEIRAFKPEDRAVLLSAVDRVGSRSRYLRFFTFKRDFTESERSFFLNVDFDRQVALVALMDEQDQKIIVGGGRYIRMEHGNAEVAFLVIDEYQGQGIGSALLRHLTIIARAAGLHAFAGEHIDAQSIRKMRPSRDHDPRSRGRTRHSSAQLRIARKFGPVSLANRRKSRDGICKVLHKFLQIPCKLVEAPRSSLSSSTSSDPALDSGLFSFRFVIVRSTAANRQAGNLHVNFSRTTG
jgi:GNAT superfamily N-acetyltransferase